MLVMTVVVAVVGARCQRRRARKLSAGVRPWAACYGSGRSCCGRAGCAGWGEGLAVAGAGAGHPTAAARGVDCSRNYLYAPVATDFACIGGGRESDCIPCLVAHLVVDHGAARPTGASWPARRLPCVHLGAPCPHGHGLGLGLVSALVVHSLVHCRVVHGRSTHRQIVACARPCDCLVCWPQPGRQTVTMYPRSYSKRGKEGIPSL